MGYGWIRGVKHLPDQDQQETIDGEMFGIGGMVKALQEPYRASMDTFSRLFKPLDGAGKEAVGNHWIEECPASFLCNLQAGLKA